MNASLRRLTKYRDLTSLCHGLPMGATTLIAECTDADTSRMRDCHRSRYREDLQGYGVRFAYSAVQFPVVPTESVRVNERRKPKAPAIRRMELVTDRHLGSGGHADVFLYRGKGLNQEFAVKILSVRSEDDEADQLAVQRFNDELDIQSSIDHPHVVKIFSNGMTESSPSRPYVAMRYYSGGSLANRLASGPLPVEQVLKIGIKIAGAVQTAHQKDILHRDIKPANILTDEYDEPALTDFGVAAAQVGLVSTQVTGISPQWSAPEAMSGGRAPEVTADVYSLAATLYHLIAGRSPFWINGGNNAFEPLLRRVLAGSPPGTGRREVPPSLENLLNRAMAKDPIGRPAAAITFAKALQDVQRELGLPVTEITVPTTSRPFPVRPDAAGVTLDPQPVCEMTLDPRSSPLDHEIRQRRTGPDPEAISTPVDLTHGLQRLAESRRLSPLQIFVLADRHPGKTLGSATEIDVQLKRASRDGGPLDRDFVAGFVRACHCPGVANPCTADCSTKRVRPWLDAHDRLTAPEKKPRRARWLIATAGLVLVLALGGGAGIVLALQRNQQSLPGSTTTPAPPAGELYRLQASLTYRADNESATLRWNPSISATEGFEAFLVLKWVDGKAQGAVGSPLPADHFSIDIPDVPKNRMVCFEVIAYGVTRPQPEAEVPAMSCNTNAQPPAASNTP